MWKQLRLKITRNYHLAKNKATGKYVRCIIHRLQKMDNANPKLGESPWGIRDYVPR